MTSFQQTQYEKRKKSNLAVRKPDEQYLDDKVNTNYSKYSCLESFTDRGAWRATGHGVTESEMIQQTNILALDVM